MLSLRTLKVEEALDGQGAGERGGDGVLNLQPRLERVGDVLDLQ